jgi:hypothetical protein
MRHGYRLAGTDYVLLASGAYGDVFASETLGLVRKVFRRDHDEVCARKTYGYEIRAYELAQSNEGVSRLVPGRFGRAPEVKVVDGQGADQSHLYYTDLVFEMEWIRASFTKIGNLTQEEKMRIQPFATELHAVGIRYTFDASVAWKTSTHPTFIDFATEEFEVIWRNSLE